MKLLMSFVKSCLVNLVVLGCLIQQLDYSNILSLPKPFSLIFSSTSTSTYIFFLLQMGLLQISALVGSHSKHLNHFFFSFFSMSTHMYDITSNQKTICTNSTHPNYSFTFSSLLGFFLIIFILFFSSLYSFIWLTHVNFSIFFLLFLDCV